MRAFDESEFSTAVKLLCEGFPERSADFWRAALQRLQRYGGNQHVQRPLGYFMLDGTTPVGIALTPASPRSHADGSQSCIVNISSWYAREAFRWRAGFMLRSILSNKAHVYTDLTPTPELQQVLPKLGMHAINSGIGLHALPLLFMHPATGAQVRLLDPAEEWPELGPPRAMIEAHRDLDCLPLVLEHSEGQELFICLRSSVRGLPAAQLIFCDDRELLLRHRGALARGLMPLGFAVFICESQDTSSSSTMMFRPRERWFATGDHFVNRTDAFASELCIIHNAPTDPASAELTVLTSGQSSSARRDLD